MKETALSKLEVIVTQDYSLNYPVHVTNERELRCFEEAVRMWHRLVMCFTGESTEASVFVLAIKCHHR